VVDYILPILYSVRVCLDAFRVWYTG